MKKVLFLFIAIICLCFIFGHHTYYSLQHPKQNVNVVMIDSTRTNEFVSPPSRNDGGDIFRVTHYLITYQDSTGIIYHRIPVSDAYIPRLGPAQIIKKDNQIVWLKNLN